LLQGEDEPIDSIRVEQTSEQTEQKGNGYRLYLNFYFFSLSLFHRGNPCADRVDGHYYQAQAKEGVGVHPK
jgi:hypothetical protein